MVTKTKCVTIGTDVTYELVGKSTDEKPTSSNGSKFTEMDTGKEYFFDGDEQGWFEQADKYLDSIAIETAPTKTAYYAGSDFDPAGMTVKATYTDESTANVDKFEVVAPAPLSIGDEVKVKYVENGRTRFADVEVEIKSNEVADVETFMDIVANGNKAVLEADMPVTRQLVFNNDFELDLNGHAISTNMSTSYVLKVDGAKVTIKGGTISAKKRIGTAMNGGEIIVEDGEFTSSTDLGFDAVGNGAKITFNGGNLHANDGGLMAFDGAEVEFNGGTLLIDDNFALGTNGSAGRGNNVITMNGGYIDAHIVCLISEDIPMKNNLIRPIAIVSSLACAAVIGLAAISSTSKLSSKGFAALISRSTSPVTDGSITFNGSDTSRSSTTYTTASSTQTGYPIKCIATNCEPANTGVVAAMQNGTIVKFYENNGSTEFEFQSIKSFSLTRSNWGTFSYTYSYVLDDGTERTSDTINQTAAQYNQTVDLTELGTVVKLSLTGASSTYIAMFTSIVLTYDCGPVIPKVLESISVTTAPTKTEYVEGDSFDPTGMVVTATYDDESTANVTSSCTFSPSENLVEGTTSVTVSYTENGITKTTTQEISVSAESSDIDNSLLSGTYSLTINTYNKYKFVFDGIGSGSYQRWYNDAISQNYTAYFTYSINSTSKQVTIIFENLTSTNCNYNNNYKPGNYNDSATWTNTTGLVNSNGSFTVQLYSASGGYHLADAVTFAKQ